ncbi:MAG: hypothetical protein ABIV63_18000 [Caldimonas sp.]
MKEGLIDRLMRFDDERAGFPGEHLFALSLGLWLVSRQAPTPAGRMMSALAGAGLVYRALSGRDGIMKYWDDWSRKSARANATRRPHERYIDIAEPTPYSKRVRVPAISQPLDRTI